MRVLVNGRFLTQQLTGVHRYALEICDALYALGVDLLVLVPNKPLTHNDISFPIERVGRFDSHLWEQMELPLYVKRHYNGQLLVNFAGLSSALYNNCVTTIHDLSFLENPKWFSLPYRLWYRWMTPITARRARRIITVSQFSRGEIVKHLGVSEEKVLVAYNAVTERLHQPKTKATERFVLTVSSLDPRKNLSRLVEAFKSLHLTDCKLMVVGAGNKVFGAVDGLETSDAQVELLGYLNDEQIVEYYSNALAFVYPSLYEGFGIPVLEAMHFGTPVIAADIPPLHEVCQDAAVYCNPYDTQSIAAEIKHLLNDDALREKLSAKGLERQRQFSWLRSGELIKTMLESLDSK